MKLKASHKLGMLFALLSCPVMSVVAQPFPDPCYFGGWSAGLGLGVTTFMSNTSHDTFAPNLTAHTNGQIYKFGPMGNVFIGYAGVWDNLYLGAELGVNFLGARQTTLSSAAQTANLVTAVDPEAELIGGAIVRTSGETYTKVTRNAVEPMLDIKPGVLFAPNGLLYARLGLSYNDLDIKSSSRYRTNGVVDPADGVVDPFLVSAATSTSLTDSNSKRVTGFRLGFGLEYMFTPQLGIGSDYVYTFYDNISASRQINTASAVACDAIAGCAISSNGRLNNQDKAKVADQEVLLQLIYHFNC